MFCLKCGRETNLGMVCYECYSRIKNDGEILFVSSLEKESYDAIEILFVMKNSRHGSNEKGEISCVFDRPNYGYEYEVDAPVECPACSAQSNKYKTSNFQKERDKRLIELINNKETLSMSDCNEMAERGRELFNKGKIRRAVKLLAYAAQHKNQAASIFLGDCYNYGNRVRKSWAQAMACYSYAANAGNPEAEFKLGVLYEEHFFGYAAGGKELIKKSAEAGYEPAQAYLRKKNL